MAKKIKLQGGGEVDPQTYIAQRIQAGVEPQDIVTELADFDIQEEEAQQLIEQVMSVMGVFQMGGSPEDAQTQKMIEEITVALQEGADPQTIIKQLIERGMTQEDATVLVNEIFQNLEQGSFQMGGEQGEEELLRQVVEALQQGIPEEEIIRMLVEEFGFPEEDAITIVQQVQGTLQRGGKAVCNCCGQTL